MKNSVFLLLGSLVLTGCASTGHNDKTAIIPSKEHFLNTATIKDDALETVARVTTERGYQQKFGLLKVVWSDNYLRGFIYKKNGAPTYQLYQEIKYTQKDWAFFDSVNYQGSKELQSTDLKVLDRQVDCTNSDILGGCTYTETVSFLIPKPLMEELATMYSKEPKGQWVFKFKSKSGTDRVESISFSELAGFYEATQNLSMKYKSNS